MMERETKMTGRSVGLFASLAAAFLLAACGGKSPPAAVTAPAAAPNETAAPTAPNAAAPAAAPNEAATAPSAVAQTLAPTETTWSPEALEELLAPVALYPDVVLGQVLVSANKSAGSARCGQLDSAEPEPEGEGSRSSSADCRFHRAGTRPASVARGHRHDVLGIELDHGARPSVRQ